MNRGETNPRETNPRETIATFNDLARADTARSLLESAGLSPILLDESTGGLHWGILPAIGGFRLQVFPEEAELAREILGREESGKTSVEEEDLWPERRRRNRIVVLVTLAILLLPLLVAILLSW